MDAAFADACSGDHPVARLLLAITHSKEHWMSYCISEYLFLFYGCSPDDWRETASPGHFYEVLFRDTPSADVKTQLGHVWEERTRLGPVASGDWLWCGRWALARVRERSSGDSEAFFEKMADLFCILHGIAPIAAVVFWGASTISSHPWERWTLARQASPPPGPLYPGLAQPSVYNQLRDASLGTPARDADFDSGRGYTSAAEPVDTRPARDLADAVARVNAFLERYSRRPEYFEDGWPALILLLVCANDDETSVEISFSSERPSDAILTVLCEKAIAALEQAHPNLGFPFTWELVGG
jgi:hypothetical protein